MWRHAVMGRGPGPCSEAEFAEAFFANAWKMATVTLKDVMKIYPHSTDEKKTADNLFAYQRFRCV